MVEPVGPQARVVATFADGTPAAVQSTFGTGRTLMLGSYVSAAYQTTPTPEVERFYAGLLAWAGVTMPVETTGDAVEVRFLESGADRIVFVLNHVATKATGAISLRVPDGAWTATDLVTDRSVALGQSAGSVQFDVTLPPHEVQVLRLSRAGARRSP
jgi:hypothetical protein